jgi:uridine phosphorylase
MVLEPLGRYAVLSDDPRGVREVAARLDEAVLVGNHREYELWQGGLADELVAVMSTGVGSPSLAIGIEELHRAGVDTILAIGQGNPFQKPSPKVCVAYAAVRQDGTGVQYLPIEFPAVADHGLVRSVLQAAKGIPLAVVPGLVRSTDALYGPTLSATDVNSLSAIDGSGVLCSDLTTAANYTIAAALGMRSVGIVFPAAGDDPGWPTLFDLAVLTLAEIIEADARVAA